MNDKEVLETRDQRLKKYEVYALKKSNPIVCPVCSKSFTNNYSLSNHFLVRGYCEGPKYLDDAHRDYYLKQLEEKKIKHKENLENKIYQKKCIRCDKSYEVNYEKRLQKRCPECEIKYPPKIKIPTRKTKIGNCTKCGLEMIIKVCSNNQICSNCREEERKEKVKQILATPIKILCMSCKKEILYYRKHVRDRVCRVFCDLCNNDPYLFKKDQKYERVIELLKKTTLTRREIKKLLGLETDYVREAAIEKFGEEWYKKRVKVIRKRGLLQSQFQRPSGLEISFTRELKIPFESNKWIVLKIDGEHFRSEIDVKIPIGDRKFAILIDGESFHGPKKFYNKDKVSKNNEDMDNVKAKALARMGYYTIRYSETEVNSGWANDHFLKIYSKFSLSFPFYYYRNWITGEEITNF